VEQTDEENKKNTAAHALGRMMNLRTGGKGGDLGGIGLLWLVNKKGDPQTTESERRVRTRMKLVQ